MNLLVSLVLIVVTVTAWVFPAAGQGGSDPAALAAARTRLLGPGWDEPGQVRLRWVDVTTFLVSFGGLVVEFDGWAIEGGVSGYAPVTVEDLIAARPEYIYAGHGHVDHMGHVGQIAPAATRSATSWPRSTWRGREAWSWRCEVAAMQWRARRARTGASSSTCGR